MAATRVPPTIDSSSASRLRSDFAYNFSYQGAGSRQSGLVWTKECVRGKQEWNAKYHLSCNLAGYTFMSFWMAGPVSHHYFQGPKIRISTEEPNPCAKLGATLRVIRDRSGVLEDITDKLLSFDGKSKYDGKDAVFWDQHDMDC